jgi:hypothetical protein
MKNRLIHFRQWYMTTPSGNTFGAVLLLLAGFGIVWFLSPFLPLGDDWRLSFSQLDFWHPFLRHGLGYGLFNPPWIMLLLPHALLPIPLGNAVNLILNIVVPMAVVHRLRGGYAALALALSSPFFLQLMITNNIDWISLAAFLVPGWLGLILLSCKPQAVGGAAIIWLRKAWDSGPRNLALLLVPIIALVLASLFIWPGWPVQLIETQYSLPTGAAWNWSIFPFALPVGIWLLWRAWREKDPILAGIATPCLVPYISPYSFSATFVLLACRNRREAMLIWFIAWWVTLVGYRMGSI